MNPMTKAVLRAGLISPNMLDEVKRFSITLDPNAKVEEPKDLGTAAKIIADALEQADMTVIRETDLAVLRQYIGTSTLGTLHVEIMEAPPAEFEVTYGKAQLGEYIIAWKGESIGEAICNGMTYLVVNVPKGTLRDLYEEKKVFFKDVRELWFGENKAFMLCTPVEEHDNAV